MSIARAKISQLPISKIFSFFGFSLISKSEAFNTYQHSNEDIYFVFREPGREDHSIFSHRSLQTVEKLSLINLYHTSDSLSSLLNLVEHISSTPSEFSNNNITEETDTKVLLNRSIGLVPIDNGQGEWYSLPQFANRIFKSNSEAIRYKLPLCIFDGRTFVRYDNVVEWDSESIVFRNSNTNGLFTSHILPQTQAIFITCNPKTWPLFSLDSKSGDHLFLICHPQSDNELFEKIEATFIDLKFNTRTFPISNHQGDVEFLLRYVFFLFSKNDFNFKLTLLQGEKIGFSIISQVQKVKEVWKQLNAINFFLEESFMKNQLSEQLDEEEQYFPLMKFEKRVAKDLIEFRVQMLLKVQYHEVFFLQLVEKFGDKNSIRFQRLGNA